MIEKNIQQKLRDEYKIDISKFSKLKSVNKGGFGSVYKVIEKETQKIYAAKIIPYHDKIKQMINREFDIPLLDCPEKVRNGLADPKYDNTARQKILVGFAEERCFFISTILSTVISSLAMFYLILICILI